MASASTCFFCVRMLFINLLLPFGSSPQRHKVIILSLVIFPDLKNDRVERFSHPANCAILLRQIRSLVNIVRVREHFLLCFLEPQSCVRGFLLNAYSSAHRTGIALISTVITCYADRDVCMLSYL
jgi:hypothetical protein